MRLAVLGAGDHPEDFAAGPDRAGDRARRLRARCSRLARGSDRRRDRRHRARLAALGPEHDERARSPTSEQPRRSSRPPGRRSSPGTRRTSSTALAPGVLFDLGDFLDDYAVDRVLRNDLGLLFLVDLCDGGVERVEAVPLKLEYCFTRLGRRRGRGVDPAAVRASLRRARDGGVGGRRAARRSQRLKSS